MTSETQRLLADTHALVWHFAESPRLSGRARELLQMADRAEAELIVPAIVIAEAIIVCERKSPGLSVDHMLARLSSMPNAVIVPLDLTVLVEALRLPPTLEMHDRIIAATAKIFSATFISRDRQLSALVDTVW